MKSKIPLRVEVTRGNLVESVHEVIAVVVDARGTVDGHWGNINYLVMPRSAIKMLQALPLVEGGFLEKFGLDEKALALACASHAGEKQHITVLADWMNKIKIKEGDLVCGAAYPSHEATRLEMQKKGVPPSSIFHNCSGKHLGIITTCLGLGENPAGYHRYEHPAQVRLRKVLSDLLRIQLDKCGWGIDGCGIPTYAVPLQSLAVGMLSFINSTMFPVRDAALAKIREAAVGNPQLLSGTGESVAEIISATQGRVILKSGAEGVFCALLPQKKQALALKVVDGGRRAAEVALLHICRLLGAISEAEFSNLRKIANPELTNSRGDRVGEIRVARGVG
ncbi:MAG: asparaginase [Bdellovibrionaceae bacterium]|nr:asparaginase [Pseudobdellovibrionaceae bacterium]